MKAEPIQDYILKSDRNLRIAAAVGEARPKARTKIVAGFIDRLDAKVKRKLQGWETAREDSEFFTTAYAGYYVAKPAWDDRYWIGFQCNDYGEKMVWGIARGTDDTRRQPLRADLLRAVQQKHPSAKSQSWWEARFKMASPAADWRKPEVLWRMHKDITFLEAVAEQLLEIAEISAPIIDRMGRKK